MTAVISNPNSARSISVTDQSTFMVTPPENTEPPLSCLRFNTIISNTSIPLYNQTANERVIMFVNGNYTDVVISGTTINMTGCLSQYGSLIEAMIFTSFNNPLLFNDIHSYQFNGSAITIPKAQIQHALSLVPATSLTSYTYMLLQNTNQMVGYQYQKLTFRVGDQTLWAKIPNTFIQIDSDNILYINGGNSYDQTGVYSSSQLNYTWTIVGLPQVQLPNQMVLTLTPAQRFSLGINQEGAYFNYSLQVQAGNKTSFPAYVQVQISPGPDPNLCVNISLKNINVTSILAYTNFPLLLQVMVQKNTSCPGLALESLIWSCNQVSWQFWQTIGNNNTIGMDKTILQQLPQSQAISMQVTQYYLLYNVEYINTISFVLLVQSPNLVAQVVYPTVFNPHDSPNLILDGSQSYDPEAAASNTQNVPVVCTWSTPIFLTYLGNTNTILRTYNGCILTIPSATILSSQNYNQSLVDQMYMFTLTITKDSRQTTQNIFLTLVDNDYYPKCSIVPQGTYFNSINLYQNLVANCANTINRVPSQFQFLWSFFGWQSLQYIVQTQQLTTNYQNLRITPYLLSQYSTLLTQVVVSADGIHTTPIGYQLMLNDQSGFTQGSININYNLFTAYLSTFIMTPQNWDSSLSSNLTFQFRYQESQNNYRLMISPVEASQSSPIVTVLPPLVYEQAIYIDIIDSIGNYITVRQPIQSIVDVKMTATQFALRINTIVQAINYQFNEVALEQNMYTLRQCYNAYMMNQLDNQSMPIQFFEILSVSTVQYLYNTFVIDNRQSQVKSYDRRAIISQHIVEVIHAMTYQLRTVLISNSTKQALQVIQQIVQAGNYSIANSFPDIYSKVFQIVYQTFDMNMSYQLNGTSSIYDQILTPVLRSSQNYLYLGEIIQSTMLDFTFQVTKLTSNSNSALSFSTFTFDQNEVFGYLLNPSGCMMALMRNDTYVYVQLYDQNLNKIGITNLNTAAAITFTLSPTVLQNYINNLVKLQCASRDSFTSNWTTTAITMGNINNATGQITCYATHFTQYTLFIINLSPQAPPPQTNTTYINPTQITNSTVNDTVIVGQWNSSLPNSTIINNNQTNQTTFLAPKTPLIFQEKPQEMYLFAIFTLVLFIITHYFFRYRYKSEHKDQPQRETKYQYRYISKQSRCRNYMRLFWLILLNFNPYLNIFCVYNKFLPRWVRNLMLQIYFMIISVSFGITQALLSLNLTNFGSPGLTIAIFFIITLGVVIVRPIAIKTLYKMLYEPNSRVEDYRDSNDNMKNSSQNFNNQIIINEQLQDFDEPNFDVLKHSTQSGKKDMDVVFHQERISIDEGKHDFIAKKVSDDFLVMEEKQKPSSFLPMLFNAKKPVPLSGFNEQNMGPEEHQNGLPNIQMHFRGFQDMAKAFDEVDIEQAPKDLFSIEEGVLNRSDQKESPDQHEGRDDFMVKAPKTQKKRVMKKKNVLRSSAQDYKENSKGHPEVPVRTSQNFDKLPPIGFGIAAQVNQDDQRRLSAQKNHLQFYQQQAQDDNSSQRADSQLDDDFNHQLEGGEIEEESKENPQDRRKLQVMSEGSLDRGGDVEYIEEVCIDSSNSRFKGHQPESRQSPMTDLMSIQNIDPTSNEKRLINIGGSPRMNLKYFSDDVVEHTMSVTNNSQEALNSPNKTVYVNKFIGKLFIVLMWGGLIVANMICLINMLDQEFYNWAILSVASYASIILVIDTLLYMILACIMLKKEAGNSLQKSQNNNESSVEYFTSKNNSSKQRNQCSMIFVHLLIGREKMKDLKRRLNPQSPI